MSHQELQRMLSDALDDFDAPMPVRSAPIAASPIAAASPSFLPAPTIVSRTPQSLAHLSSKQQDVPVPAGAISTLMTDLVADLPTSSEPTLMAEAGASPTSALPTPTGTGAILTLMANLVADLPTSTALTLMAEMDSSPTSALPTATLMADSVADLPTSTTMITMTEAGASFLTKQYQVGQRLHSQCHELCDQHGVLMLATQPNITQTEYCDIDSLTPAELNAVLACPVGGHGLDGLTPAELNTVLACPVDGQSPPGSDNGRDLDNLRFAELERRKRQKRRRRARLKLLACEKAAKQVRRRTLSGGKQRHKQGGVRKKSAASRRRSAERTSSWVRNQPDSFSDDDGESWMQM